MCKPRFIFLPDDFMKNWRTEQHKESYLQSPPLNLKQKGNSYLLLLISYSSFPKWVLVCVCLVHFIVLWCEQNDKYWTLRSESRIFARYPLFAACVGRKFGLHPIRTPWITPALSVGVMYLRTWLQNITPSFHFYLSTENLTATFVPSDFKVLRLTSILWNQSSKR